MEHCSYIYIDKRVDSTKTFLGQLNIILLEEYIYIYIYIYIYFDVVSFLRNICWCNATTYSHCTGTADLVYVPKSQDNPVNAILHN